MANLLAAVLLLAPALPARAQVKNPDTFVEVKAGEVASLDPAYPYDDASQALIYNLYEPLIGFDGPSLDKFVPLLASRVPSVDNGLISKDGRTYRFPIRGGVRFQDGSR